MSAAVKLHPVVEDLAGEVTIGAQDHVFFPDAAMVTALGACSAVDETERAPLAEQLIAYALLCKKVARAGAAQARGQLCFLASLLVGVDATLSEAVAAGVGSRAALSKCIAAEQSNRPIGGPRSAGATSPLGVRLGKR